MRNKLALTLLLLTGCDAIERIEPRPYRAIDGDTIKVGSGPNIRLAGIDTPELPGHCRPGRRCVKGDPYAARQALQTLLNNGEMVCRDYEQDRYGRRIADCTIGHLDLGGAMLALGYAQPYER